MDKEKQNPKTHLLVYGTIFKKTTGAVEGLNLYRIDDWDAFRTMTEEDQYNYLKDKRADGFGKKSKKGMPGNPGTVYQIEYSEGEEAGQYSIYPNTARYVTRVKTSYAHRWDETERAEVSANRTRNMANKQEKLRLRDTMEWGDMKQTYRYMTTAQKAAFVQSILNELFKVG